MANLAWVTYIALFYLSLLEVLLSEDVGRSSVAETEMIRALQPLDSLCADNMRTHSWWTYAICFKRSILQVHVDSRTKSVTDRIALGQFVSEESTPVRQMYRTAEAKCAVKTNTDGSASKKEQLLPRTTVVHLKCCDVVVHLMRQSRHTPVTADSNSKSAYYWPEQAISGAAEELSGRITDAATSSNTHTSAHKHTASYRGSMSTATAEAYIHSVEEHSACNYEVTVCSEYVCDANGGHTEAAHPSRQHERDGKNTQTANQNHHPHTHTQQQQQYTRDPREPLNIVPAKAPKNPAAASVNSANTAGKNSAGASINSKPGNNKAGNSGAANKPAANHQHSNQQAKQQPKRSLGPHTTPSTTERVVSQANAEGEDAFLHSSTDEVMSVAEQLHLKERTRQMFYHAYDSYMHHAFPEAELCPVSCTGGKFDLIKIPMVTLIDTLDTLVILGNYSEFRRGVQLVTTAYPSFNLDVNVSVFETTIRVLGGMLSAHLLAVDPKLAIYSNEHAGAYNNELLQLSMDLADRLLPAFKTRTLIPYGTVNLRYGVPYKETKIASTAGAGSLLLEFQVLSHLSGDSKYGMAAYSAMKGLYMRKSNLGLLGKHINTETGQWSESLSGVGSNADSFYEYLLKAYLLFRDKELFGMFSDAYRAIKQFVMVNDHWFTEVDMFSGKLQRKRVENLDAFWPGVEAILGFTGPGASQLNTFYSVWQDLGFLPEEIEYSQWQSGKGAVNGLYPLRPELIESTYFQYRATGDRSWLQAGKVFLESIERHTRTDCGYATVADVNTMVLVDTMPSFFLSETCKYLFLLFDDANFINHRPYIFSTEAHPFESTQVHFLDIRGLANSSTNSTSSSDTAVAYVSVDGDATVTDSAVNGAAKSVVPVDGQPTDQFQVQASEQAQGQQGGKRKKKRKSKSEAATSILDDVHRKHQSLLQSLKQSAHNIQVLPMAKLQEPLQAMAAALPPVVTANVPVLEGAGQDGLHHPQGTYLPLKCRKPQWWDRSVSFDNAFLQEINSGLRKEVFTAKAPAARKNRLNPAVTSSSTTSSGAFSGVRASGRSGPLRRIHQLGAGQLSRGTMLLLDLIQNLHADTERIAKLRSRPPAVPTTANSAVPGAVADVPATPTTPLLPRVTKLKWYEVKSHLFPHETCSPADQPSLKRSGKKGSQPEASPSETAAPQVEALKTVKVNMGPLGEFLINVYTDGFYIHSEQDDIQLEISNIGRSLVLLRENVQALQSKVVMANVENHSATSCRVQVLRTESATEGDNQFTQRRTADAAVVFDRPCSVANFGVTADGVGVDIRTSSVLSAPPRNLFCDLTVPIVSSAAAVPGTGPSASTDDNHQSSPNNWWQWTLRQFMTSDRHRLSDAAKSDSVPTLALVDRGDCLFEDKASNAAKSGAQAVIVRNSEDAVFIMAGKRDVDAAGAPEAETLAVADKAPKLPVTVMLSRNDGDHFAELMLEEGSGGNNDGTSGVAPYSQEYRIHTTVSNALLGSDIMGSTEYPRMYTQKKTIFILGSGGWGTLLKATKGDDWQLFIMSKEDVYSAHLGLLPPNFVHSAAMQPQTLPHTVLSDPSALYLYTIHRKCPNMIMSVVGGTVQLL